MNLYNYICLYFLSFFSFSYGHHDKTVTLIWTIFLIILNHIFSYFIFLFANSFLNIHNLYIPWCSCIILQQRFWADLYIYLLNFVLLPCGCWTRLNWRRLSRLLWSIITLLTRNRLCIFFALLRMSSSVDCLASFWTLFFWRSLYQISVWILFSHRYQLIADVLNNVR